MRLMTGFGTPGDPRFGRDFAGTVEAIAEGVTKSIGAEVTGVCSTRNVEMVKSIGADYVVDYKRENYTDSGLQYDLIIDNVGNHSLSANRRALKSEGKLVIIGGPKGDCIGLFVIDRQPFPTGGSVMKGNASSNCKPRTAHRNLIA